MSGGEWLMTGGEKMRRDPIPEQELGKWAAPRESDFPGTHQPGQELPDPGAGGDYTALQRAQERGHVLDTISRGEPPPVTEEEGQAARDWMAQEAGAGSWEELVDGPLWIPDADRLPPVREADLLADWAAPREDDYGGGPVAWDIDIPVQDQGGEEVQL